jgi:hypothetical protein
MKQNLIKPSGKRTGGVQLGQVKVKIIRYLVAPFPVGTALPAGSELYFFRILPVIYLQD